ncbi:hypothetical protein, partial [Pradoshia sp.]|uniref:hypothetical protein n=1 Tax=Pradoshia sp. TaxID=2651281 RepID=UPI003F0337CF
KDRLFFKKSIGLSISVISAWNCLLFGGGFPEFLGLRAISDRLRAKNFRLWAKSSHLRAKG